MKTNNQDRRKMNKEVTSQNSIDESPLAKPELSGKEAKTENRRRRVKKEVDKKSEWNA